MAILLGVCLAPASQATTSFVTIPASGDIFGFPNSTTGWGFTLVNDTNYVITTSSTFFQLTGPGIGSYSDIIGTEFFPVGPGTTTTWTQTFSASVPSGIGSFTINPAVAFGTKITGTITVLYDVWQDQAGTVLVSGGQSFTVPVSIEVIPEPATGWLLGAALVMLGVSRVRRTVG
jgi:hypothetical protein